MPRFINEGLRQRMKPLVHNCVAKRYDASPVGLEYHESKREVGKAVRKFLAQQFPNKDMLILQKYGKATEIDCVKLDVSEEGEVRSAFRYTDNTTVVFLSPVLVPHATYDAGLAKLINEHGQHLVALLSSFIKLSRMRDCEIRKVVDAYMQRTHFHRTVERLLGSYPDMAAMVPKPKKTKPNEPPEGEKLIASFEETMEVSA